MNYKVAFWVLVIVVLLALGISGAANHQQATQANASTNNDPNLQARSQCIADARQQAGLDPHDYANGLQAEVNACNAEYPKN